MKNEILKHIEFEKSNLIIIDNVYSGYDSKEKADTFAELKCKWWGSNLVYLGAEFKHGVWIPYFNVWD